MRRLLEAAARTTEPSLGRAERWRRSKTTYGYDRGSWRGPVEIGDAENTGWLLGRLSHDIYHSPRDGISVDLGPAI